MNARQGLQPQVSEHKNTSIAWHDLLRLSQEMLDTARTGDWQKLAEIEQRRHPLLHAYFNNDAGTVTPIEQAQRIRQLQAIEEEVLAECKASRKITGDELQEMQRGKKAGQAYLSASA